MKRIVKNLVIVVVAIVVAVCVWYYIDTKDFRDENGPIEVTVGETFDMKFEGTPPLALNPCWLDIPDGIALAGLTHRKGLYEHLNYIGVNDGTDIYTFKAMKEGSYKLIRGECLAGSPEGGWDEEMKEMDSTVTGVYTVIVTR